SGVEIRLAVSKEQIDWDEPVDLVLTLVNRSSAPARIPFEKPGRREASGDDPAVARGVREVAELLDIGDFLSVTAPDGEEVELRVDDISSNPFIAAVVHLRAEGGPVMTLAPGEKLEYRIAGFNRTWARYPLLEAGSYSLRFSYTPEWDDPVLRDAGVGVVQTAPVTIKVRAAAPEIVRTHGHPVRIRAARDGDALLATLTNASDLPLVVNLNFGHDDPPSAQVWWVLRVGEEIFKLRAGPEARSAALEAFSRDKLKELRPGQSVEIGRIPISTLESQPLAASLPAGAEFQVRASCANRVDLAWQMAQSNLIGSDRAPEALRRPLPDRLFSFQTSSDELTLTKSK
ncbi:MAG TPA: hypothetical protein VGM03_24600, partial [Phycisphaerae bacterium]